MKMCRTMMYFNVLILFVLSISGTSAQQDPTLFKLLPESKTGIAFNNQLTYKYQGRRFRLTDVEGHIIKDILT